MNNHRPTRLRDLAGNAMSMPVVQAVYTSACAACPELIDGVSHQPPSRKRKAEGAGDGGRFTLQWARELKAHSETQLANEGGDQWRCQVCGLTESGRNKWKFCSVFACGGPGLFKDAGKSKRRRLLYHLGSAWRASKSGNEIGAQSASEKLHACLCEVDPGPAVQSDNMGVEAREKNSARGKRGSEKKTYLIQSSIYNFASHCGAQTCYLKRSIHDECIDCCTDSL